MQVIQLCKHLILFNVSWKGFFFDFDKKDAKGFLFSNWFLKTQPFKDHFEIKKA